MSALLAKAVGLALTKHPLLNSAYAPDAIQYNPDINVAMAVALPDGGLITPVLKKVCGSSIRSWRRADALLTRTGKEYLPSPHPLLPHPRCKGRAASPSATASPALGLHEVRPWLTKLIHSRF